MYAPSSMFDVWWGIDGASYSLGTVLQIGLCVLGNEMVNWHEYATNFESSDMK